MKPLQPRKIDMQKWRRLVREARSAARTPRGPSGDLARAASTACRAVAPTRELLTGVCSPLLREAERFAAMHPSHPGRPDAAAKVGRLAEQLAPHVGMGPAGGGSEPLPPADDDGEDDRPQRKDIYG